MKNPDRPPMKKAEKVGSLLKQLLRQPGVGEQISRHQAWLIWDQLVGEQIAQRARPLRLRKGVLEVQVDHPVWMQQLQMLKPKILEKINAKIPAAGIDDIYLRQSKTPQARHQYRTQHISEPPRWTKVELTRAEKEEIEAALDQVADAELREELLRLFTRQKQLDKDRHS